MLRFLKWTYGFYTHENIYSYVQIFIVFVMFAYLTINVFVMLRNIFNYWECTPSNDTHFYYLIQCIIIIMVKLNYPGLTGVLLLELSNASEISLICLTVFSISVSVLLISTRCQCVTWLRMQPRLPSVFSTRLKMGKFQLLIWHMRGSRPSITSGSGAKMGLSCRGNDFRSQTVPSYTKKPTRHNWNYYKIKWHIWNYYREQLKQHITQKESVIKPQLKTNQMLSD